MDILDPLEPSVSTEDGDGKVMLNQNIKILDDQSMESDDEQHVVDHLSPQTLLETPPDEVQYSFRSPEGTITYGVLKVEDGVDGVSQIVTAGSNFSNPAVQQVLTSNINGQLYVIGSTNEVFVNQSGTRAIAPRSTIVDSAPALPSQLKKRDERRRATHNEVERRRRDKINNWIMKLSKIIPENPSSEMKGNGHYDGQSKGGILAKACEYILELKDVHQTLETSLKQNKQLEMSVDVLKQRNMALENENMELRELLKTHGIETTSANLS